MRASARERDFVPGILRQGPVGARGGPAEVRSSTMRERASPDRDGKPTLSDIVCTNDLLRFRSVSKRRIQQRPKGEFTESWKSDLKVIRLFEGSVLVP